MLVAKIVRLRYIAMNVRQDWPRQLCAFPVFMAHLSIWLPKQCLWIVKLMKIHW